MIWTWKRVDKISESSRYSGRPSDKNAKRHCKHHTSIIKHLGTIHLHTNVCLCTWKEVKRKNNTLENSSSETWSFFCTRNFTSPKVSPSCMTKKNGSPKFCTCWSPKTKQRKKERDVNWSHNRVKRYETTTGYRGISYCLILCSFFPEVVNMYQAIMCSKVFLLLWDLARTKGEAQTT